MSFCDQQSCICIPIRHTKKTTVNIVKYHKSIIPPTISNYNSINTTCINKNMIDDSICNCSRCHINILYGIWVLNNFLILEPVFMTDS